MSQLIRLVGTLVPASAWVVLAILSGTALYHGIHGRLEAAQSARGKEQELTRKDFEATMAEVNNRLDRQATRLLSAMEVFVGTVGLIAIFGAGLGYWELSKLQGARDKAEACAHEAKEAALRIGGIRLQVEKHQATLNALLSAASEPIRNELTGLVKELELTWVVGTNRATFPRDLQIQFEDIDVAIVVADRLQLPQDSQAAIADHFFTLCRYWRVVSEYPKALARIRRARDLSGSFSMALEVAKTLAYWAAENRPEGKLAPAEKARVIDQALEAINNARTLAANGDEHARTCHWQGWVLDEAGRLAEAVNAYSRGLELKPPRETMLPLRYHRACSYAKQDQLGESLDDLECALDDPRLWEICREDPDLSAFRRNPEWSKKLADLVADKNPSRA